MDVKVMSLFAFTASRHGLQSLDEKLLHEPPAVLLQPFPHGHRPRSLPRFRLFLRSQPADPLGFYRAGPQRADQPSAQRAARQQHQREGSHAEPQQPTGQLPGQGVTRGTVLRRSVKRPGKWYSEQ